MRSEELKEKIKAYHSGKRESFSGTEIYEFDFSIFDNGFPHADFSESHLLRSRFSSVNLSDTNFTSCEMNLSSFDSANLQHAELSSSIFIKASFEGANLRHANLNKSDFSAARFDKAVLSNSIAKDANFYRASCPQAIFSKADLEGVLFKEANLFKASFLEANLVGANFRESKFFQTDLFDADLRGTNFENVDLKGCNFTFGRNWEKSKFQRSLLPPHVEPIRYIPPHLLEDFLKTTVRGKTLLWYYRGPLENFPSNILPQLVQLFKKKLPSEKRSSLLKNMS